MKHVVAHSQRSLLILQKKMTSDKNYARKETKICVLVLEILEWFGRILKYVMKPEFQIIKYEQASIRIQVDIWRNNVDKVPVRNR